jgi:hypothetical protein
MSRERILLVRLWVLALLVWGCGGGSSSPNPRPSVVTFESGGNYPEGIGIDQSDHVWIANRYSNSVAELGRAGTILARFSAGKRPHGLKIDRANTGNIWVQAAQLLHHLVLMARPVR